MTVNSALVINSYGKVVGRFSTMLRKTEQCKRAGKLILEYYGDNEIGFIEEFNPEFNSTYDTVEDVNFDIYTDLCTECEDHDKCHKNGIDYAKVAKCLTEIEQELARIRYHP